MGWGGGSSHLGLLLLPRLLVVANENNGSIVWLEESVGARVARVI